MSLVGFWGATNDLFWDGKMIDVRHALSDHDEASPLSPDELMTLAREMEDSLINNECNFRHPDWRYVDGLRATALYLGSLKLVEK